ncbi:uncharacterized protein SCHCODRAFT_01206047 [Schizophyllum commune H4-8]|uniref:U1-type domain-containing protein n=1 Tax=Schizophyllum commune (strain H4-8 / FGSC 9210) TaxID=578458 RepID=D8PMQ7_SCHCM|nr:uncharacterized protein SCHCODRAFT_01206047 [Schizophyllum commune H4-8]KAI5898734.1 hypothetical protein SCHCODRAFT_01206047 [Schizophyllum commune H4-8]
MADVRALLKQKRQQAAPRITHPLAQYTPNNQLQCKACNIPVKEFMWEGHVGSKKHRTAVARLREEQARAEAARAAEEAQEHEDEDEYEEADGKRKKTSEPDEAPAKRQKGDNAGGFPSDFFSDPNRQLPPSTADDDDEDGDGMQVDGPPADQQAPAADDPLAAEYAAFMASVAQTAADAEEAHHDKYERATVFAEAQINNDALVGMPQAAEPVIAERVDEGAPPDDPEETEEQKRERIDREIIMDRLIEEERAQEEADMKVAMMKRRLEELKARKAKKKAGS